MSKLALAVIVATVSALSWTSPSSAATAPSYAVDGSLHGTGTLEFPSATCGGNARQTTTASADVSPFGAVNLSLEFCAVGLNSSVAVVDGTFVLTATDGTVTGAVTGTEEPGTFVPGSGFPLHFTLEPDAGTGRYVGIDGSVTLEGFYSISAIVFDAVARGTVSFGPAVATSRTECRNAGWQTLGDPKGNPFKNQGQCVAFVSRPTP